MNKNPLLILGLVAVALIVIGTAAWIITMRGFQSSVATPNPITTGTPPKIITTANNSTTSASSTQPVNSTAVNEYIVNEPNALILVDSQGRRTGKDPIAGTLYREIPNTTYVEEATSPGHPNGELFTSNLANGQYTLYVLGGKTGPYALDIATERGQQGFQGDIQSGSMIAYVQDYNSSNLASSTFSFEGTSSSTASITTAPPINWTPPPVR